MKPEMERLIVEATKEGPTGFTLCDDCGDALVDETWNHDWAYVGPDYLCKPCADKRRDLRARAERAEAALGALGVIGGGYCFCSANRDPNKADHQPECRDARATLATLAAVPS